MTCSDSLAVALRVHPLLAGDPPRVQDGACALLEQAVGVEWGREG